ncbi:MAG: hypothetical protein ICV57_09275 [Rubrobacter sp.]|nr:hypothetical protein [Rubrobacter sp.]
METTKLAPRRAFLALLFVLLSCVLGCGVLEPGTAQPPSAGSLVVSFIDVG